MRRARCSNNCAPGGARSSTSRDRGDASAFGLGLLFSFQRRFVLPVRRKNHRLDAAGNRRPCWRIPFGKGGWQERLVWDSWPGMWVHASILAEPLRHPAPAAQPLWLVVSRSKGGEPWYRLPTEPIETTEDAWRVMVCYARRRPLEQTWRYDKSERAEHWPGRVGRVGAPQALSLAHLRLRLPLTALAGGLCASARLALAHVLASHGLASAARQSPALPLALGALWPQARASPHWWQPGRPRAQPAASVVMGRVIVVEERPPLLPAAAGRAGEGPLGPREVDPVKAAAFGLGKGSAGLQIER